jgi:ribosomal-protein-alanine N-acetyltransferase
MARSAAPSQPVLKWCQREALANDAANLAAIDAAASTDPWSESQFAAVCANAQYRESNNFLEGILVLESSGEICAYVAYSRVLDEASILNVAVHPQWQGQGKARLLLQATLDLLSQQGAKRCLLEVRDSNTVARGLYQSMGFQVDGRRQNYYPTQSGREDALLMSKECEKGASQ